MTQALRAELRVLPSDFDKFREAMLAAAPQESVGLIFAGWWADDEALRLTWRDFWPATDSAYAKRGPAGAQVDPEFLMPAVKRCRMSGEALVLAHTHPFSAIPSFSGIDDGGEDSLIPKVSARAPLAPHGALVLGQEGAAVRVWPGTTDGPIAAALRIVGATDVTPGESSPHFARQELALGPGSAAALAKQHVGIVGTGGLGWEMATLLWSLGVGRLTLVDPDTVERHNRPRLRGSVPGDDGRPKVEALAELLHRTRPTGSVTALQAPVEAPGVRRILGSADLLMSGTDTLASRLVLDRLSRRCLIPLVDAGINVQLADSAIARVGGRVSVSWPEGSCLSCMQVLTPDAIAAESDPLGYRGRGRNEEASVIAFNAVLAGLAVAEALDLLLSYRRSLRSSRYLTYDGLRGLTREVAVPAANACGNCKELRGAVFGKLDAQ